MKHFVRRLSQLRKEKQLARVLSYKFLVHTGIGRFFSFRSQGLRLRLLSSEMTYESWKTPANYRSDDKAFLERVLRPGDFVVDAGANIGLISMQSAKLVGNSGHVIAIEPNPRIAPILEANLHLNQLRNVTVIQTALGAKDGVTSFACDKCDDRSRVIAEGGISVPIKMLDTIIKTQPARTIKLLKIDVEGYELMVLEGAEESLKRTEWLYIEVDAPNYSRYDKTTGHVTELLDSYGFDTFVSDEAGNWTRTNGGFSRSVNLIGKKRGNLPTPELASALSPRANLNHIG